MKKHKIILLVTAVALILTTLGVIFAISSVSRWQEFCMSESIKGYWVGIQDFAKAKGRYPENVNELNSYYKYYPAKDELPIIYIKPVNKNENKVVLWVNKTSWAGNRIGITEFGIVVKEKVK